MWDRWQTRRGNRPEKRLPVRFGWLYGLALLGTLTHPALDWLNVYGIRLLEPFSSRWFYGDVLFIIDVWLWLLMGTATWLSLRRERRGGEWRRPARIALSIALAYIGANAAITARAEAQERSSGERVVIASPPPFAFWRREIILGSPGSWRVRPPGQTGIGPISNGLCDWSAVAAAKQDDPQLAAFLFWSRAPCAEASPDGTVFVRDARYYDPRAKDRFTVPLPGLRCEPRR